MVGGQSLTLSISDSGILLTLSKRFTDNALSDRDNDKGE